LPCYSANLSQIASGPNGFVVVDDYLQVKGAEDVWAVGDVSAIEPAQFTTCDKQSAQLAKNITLILSNKTPMPSKKTTSRMIAFLIAKFEYSLIILQVYWVSRLAGRWETGHFGNMKMPGFIILWSRKTLFLENMGPTVDGSKF